MIFSHMVDHRQLGNWPKHKNTGKSQFTTKSVKVSDVEIRVGFNAVPDPVFFINADLDLAF